MKNPTEYNREYARRIRKKRSESGLCVCCGKNPPEKGKHICAACSEYRRQHNRLRYRRLKEAGLCIRCGKAPPRPGKTLCFDCAVKYSEYNYRTPKKLTTKD